MNYSLTSTIKISRNMKILYVEDNIEVQNQTIKMLKNFFLNIVAANHGLEGLAIFKKETFHVIFTDIEMPNMNGVTMIEKIREINKNIPIIIFSAHAKSEYFLKTINLGIDGYILKPYDLKKVINVITKIVTKLNIEIKQKNKISLLGGYYWDYRKNELSKNNKIIKLTKNEIKLFEILCSLKERIISNEDIEEFIFGDFITDNKRVRNLISRLKTKLTISLIESTYGNGYKLKKPETI